MPKNSSFSRVLTVLRIQGLLKAILMAFSSSIVSSIELVTSVTASTSRGPPAFDPASRTALGAFATRHRKMVKNLLLWRRYAPNEVVDLVDRVVHSILRPVLFRCWESGGQDIAVKVCQAMMLSSFRPLIYVYLVACKGFTQRVSSQSGIRTISLWELLEHWPLTWRADTFEYW
jgi:hypothetical protein